MSPGHILRPAGHVCRSVSHHILLLVSCCVDEKLLLNVSRKKYFWGAEIARPDNSIFVDLQAYLSRCILDASVARKSVKSLPRVPSPRPTIFQQKSAPAGALEGLSKTNSCRNTCTIMLYCVISGKHIWF